MDVKHESFHTRPPRSELSKSIVSAAAEVDKFTRISEVNKTGLEKPQCS